MSARATAAAARVANAGEGTLAAGGWAARLELRFERRPHACVLAHVCHEGPLTVQRALHPEGLDACHAVILHPPGGVAGGDSLDVDIAVRERAHAVLTMPGAAKFYRCDSKPSRQRVRLDVASGAIAEWLPPESIVFDGARATSELEIDVAADGCMIGWDVVALGRRARGESFASGRWRQRLAIRRAGRLLAEDTLDLAGGDAWLRARPGLGGAPVFGTMVAVAAGMGPVIVDACRDAIDAQRDGAPDGTPLGRAPPWGEAASGRFGGIDAPDGTPPGRASPRGEAAAGRLVGMSIGVTMPAPGLMVARCLADEAETVRGAFVAIWTRLRPALAGLDARPLRLWTT